MRNKEQARGNSGNTESTGFKLKCHKEATLIQWTHYQIQSVRGKQRENKVHCE